MSESGHQYVFDTGPLRHFALRGWLGALKLAVGGSAIIPESVETELLAQSSNDRSLAQIFDEGWIRVERPDDHEYLEAFAHYAERIVSHGRNIGECGVLALSKCYGYIAVLDDGVARTIAKKEKLELRGTIGLMVELVNKGLMTKSGVAAVMDDLAAGEYRLPFKPGGFLQWAEREGLL